MFDTKPLLLPSDFAPLSRASIETLQVNLGYLCNQRCLHCHVNAGPTRTELMTAPTVDLVLEVAKKLNIKTLDLTGGAPEMNPEFRRLVQSARRSGIHVIDRCNLSILTEPGYESLAQFLSEQEVEVVASLPCYSEDNVDSQRGEGVFDRSITGLKMLNDLGYGHLNSKLTLNLVYNPQGPSLPPGQAQLEQQYKTRLQEDFDIVFNQLFVLANMPIQRFGSMLHSKGQFETYINLLKSAHQDANLATVMCRHQLSVDWQGHLYDCDFNQMLNMPAQIGDNLRPHLRDLLTHSPVGNSIGIADHCYGCTAGQGSSCGGALEDKPINEKLIARA